MKDTVIKKLVIGRHSSPFPLVLGGMGVRISAGRLAGHVARCGGFGTVAAAGSASTVLTITGVISLRRIFRHSRTKSARPMPLPPDGIIVLTAWWL